MTVGRALARVENAAVRRRAKDARQVPAVSNGPPCHSIRRTPTVLAVLGVALRSWIEKRGCEKRLWPFFDTPWEYEISLAVDFQVESGEVA